MRRGAGPRGPRSRVPRPGSSLGSPGGSRLSWPLVLEIEGVQHVVQVALPERPGVLRIPRMRVSAVQKQRYAVAVVALVDDADPVVVAGTALAISERVPQEFAERATDGGASDGGDHASPSPGWGPRRRDSHQSRRASSS